MRTLACVLLSTFSFCYIVSFFPTKIPLTHFSLLDLNLCDFRPLVSIQGWRAGNLWEVRGRNCWHTPPPALRAQSRITPHTGHRCQLAYILQRCKGSKRLFGHFLIYFLQSNYHNINLLALGIWQFYLPFRRGLRRFPFVYWWEIYLEWCSKVNTFTI